MTDQDKLQSLNNKLKGALKAAFPDLEFSDLSTVKEVSGRLLGAIVAMKRSCVEGKRASTGDLSCIMGLEKRIRNNKNEAHQSTRDESSFSEAFSQASRLATYYKTPGNYLARNGNLEGYEGAAEGLEEILAETLRLGIQMTAFALRMLERYKKLGEEFEDLKTRLGV